jgi:hypothetical protein
MRRRCRQVEDAGHRQEHRADQADQAHGANGDEPVVDLPREELTPDSSFEVTHGLMFINDMACREPAILMPVPSPPSPESECPQTSLTGWELTTPHWLHRSKL